MTYVVESHCVNVWVFCDEIVEEMRYLTRPKGECNKSREWWCRLKLLMKEGREEEEGKKRKEDDGRYKADY